MNESKNLLLKLFVLLTVAVGGINSAWADRVEPQIVSVFNSDAESDRTTWCYIHFVNGNGGYVYCEANGNNLAFSNNKRANFDNFWALIGTREDFVLRNHNGLYAKLQGDKYVGTSVEAEATHCTYTENTNGNSYWNLHRLDASAGLNWNPQTQIKEWTGNADGGSRMEFVPVSKEEWLEMTYSNLHVLQYSSAPSGSEWAADTRWYTIKNYRSNNYLANCAGYTDASGYLKTRGSGTIAEGTDQWCFVKDANDKVTIYNKAAGTGQVLGSTTNLAASNQLTKLYDKDAAVANVSKLYTIGDNNSGFYVKIDGLNNGYWDDNQSSGLLKTWEVAGAATSDGGRFLVTEVIPEGYQLIIEGDNGNNYAVTYSGNTYHHGDIMPMTIDDVNLHDLRDFSIDCSDKFVWGPVIKKGRKTVTFEIRNPVAPETGKWYKIQVLPTSGHVSAANTADVVNTVNEKVKDIGVKSKYIYLQNAEERSHRDTYQSIHNFMGLPEQEAAGYIYVTSFSNNNIMIKHINGRYVDNDGKQSNNANTNSDITISRVNSGSYVGAYSWNRWQPWLLNDADIAPYIGRAATSTNNFQTYFAEIDPTEKFDVYHVTVQGGNSSTTIEYVGSDASANHGFSTIYNEGYFFFERGYIPTPGDFNIVGVTFASMTMDIEGNNGIKTLHFKENTAQWYTIKNTRKNNFISVSANGLTTDQQLKWGATTATTAGDYWMMVTDGSDGFYLVNKAYGPDFVLGMESTANGARLRMYHISEAESANTHFDRVPTNRGGFSIVQHNHNNIGFHDLNSELKIWNGNNVNDEGSNFVFTPVENSIISTIPEYTVYKIDVSLGTQLAKYSGSDSNIIGQTNVGNGHYMVLKSDVTPDAADFNFTELTVTDSSTDPSYKIITLSGEEKLPRILHRRAYFYDKYNTVSADKRPANSSYVGKEYPDGTDDADKGFVMNGSTKIQKTAEYRIPIYIAPGTSRQMYMPTDKLDYYQRWYDYTTEGLVNQGVIPELYSSNFKAYSNGHLAGEVVSGIHGFWQSNITMYLPKTLPKDAGDLFYEDYIVGVDVSRFKDNSTNNTTGDLTEPTLSQRVLFEIKDANKIATELTACVDNDKWLESRNIIFPTIKRGTTAHFTDKDALPIDMDLNNYWVYNSSHKLVQLTSPNQIRVEVDDNTAKITAELMPSIGNNVGWGGVNFSQSHFISFSYPGEGPVRAVDNNSHATVKVYFVEGGKDYQLAKFELTFVANTDPKIITEVIGRQENGEYKSQRSPYWMEENFGRPVAELTFDNKNILMKDNLPAGGVDNAGGTDIGTYLFPLDFNLTNYAYGYEKGDGTARGEYTIANARHIPGGQNANFRFKPVQNYYDTLNRTSSEANNDQFYLYVDASDQPGEVMSLQINEHLCEGTRLYVSGWMSVTSNNSNPASVLLNLVAKNSETGDSEILTSYCPGMLHTFMFDEQGNEVAKMDKNTGEASSGIVVNTQYWGLWSQLSFSFLLSSKVAKKYDTFQVQVLNNCYNSSGGDYLLDNFQIFANPPKGNVDFTTPLCSDKVRHAKVHADYDMLKDLSADGVNDVGNDATWDIAASYCFVDAEMFDNYQVPAELGDNLTVKDLFVMDEKGNHNLKPEYNSDKAEEVINKAFDAAMVGRRCTKDKTDAEGNKYKDFGFHSFIINKDYEQIPVYAYNDSENDVVYRETDGEIHRVVFKQDVVRGEMYKLTDKSDSNRQYYPYMRPSRTYYLVFAPQEVTEESLNKNGIRKDDVATDIFGIHQTCSFFGKFTTKDPLHVILDNADIESDLPIRAVCYGETTAFSFDIPAMKIEKNYPIVDEAYCTSDESVNGQVVPESQGLHHYRYEESFKDNKAIINVIQDLPYDWWLGGKYDETHSYRGTIEAYQEATHPTIRYAGPKDIAHKQDDAPVNLAQAMIDFRFFYPDFGKGGGTLDWTTVTKKDYNSDTGYGLLDSEIATIKDFVERGLLVLHRNTYDMPLTYEEAEELQTREVSDMMEKEMNDRILALALELDKETAIAEKLPLKALESTVLDKLSPEGREHLTFEEFASMTYEQAQGIAVKLGLDPSLPEYELRIAVETALRAKTEEEFQVFARDNFPNIGSTKRAYLVVRALNLLSKETVKKLSPADQQNSAATRQALRQQMISIFEAQDPVVLRKMWADASAELTEAERTALLTEEGKDGKPATILNPATMDDAAKLAVLIEDALAKITDNVINDLKSDRYLHFTLVPIMPSQKNFVDEPYIICPEPRGVKMRITSKAPRMFDGFADMPYPDDMDNVPVRIGLQQIDAVPYSDANDAKTLRIPLRRLSRAQEDGTLDQFEVNERGYGRYLFLVETNDPAYKRDGATAAADGLTKAELLPVDDDPKKDYPADEDDEFGRHHLIGMVSDLQASYDKEDNYMNILFNPDFKFREGYTYRVGFNFVESTSKTDAETGEVVYERNQSCFGTMLFDIKIVPEYQKWTGAVSDDWTNDANWQRADRSDLHADNLPTGEVITGSTAYAKATATDGEAAKRYPTNETNETAESFIPMAFTNTLIAEGASVMPQLYNVIPAHHPYKDSDDNVVEGAFVVLNTTTASDKAKYDMEVYDATGAWHDKDNFECGLFGTYVAKGVTFEPATSLYNAQLLSYQKAWVEYSLNANRWYTIASPLQETYSGEWYSPTGSGDGKGKQLTPHFYGITYQTNLNDRFNPAYYQRSWDKGTANMFRCFNDSHDPSTYYLPTVNPLNVAIGLDWSHVYNDVKVDYSNGGFSVKPAFGDDSEGAVLVRMPKDDASYNYYDKGNEEATNVHPGNPTGITRDAGHHRLISDKLATAENFTQSITNANGDKNPYYLVANPFMAPMDMDKFFAENTQFEAGKFWIMADNLQEVNVKSDNGWISTTGDNAVGTVAPLQAFFVKLSDPTKEAVTVTYNAAMQKQLAADESRPVLKAPAQQSSSSLSSSSSSSLILHIEATDADGALQSQAAVVFSETADNAFRAGEDAELLLDGNTAEEIATVFTAAPTTETDEAQAMQFNALSRTVTTIPVGVIAPTDETETTLTFTGVTALTDVMAEAPYLYDAANGSFTALDEETTLTVTGTSSGRYFIVSGMHIPYDNADDNDNGEALKSYNLHGIRVATPQRGTVTIRGSRKEFNR